MRTMEFWIGLGIGVLGIVVSIVVAIVAYKKSQNVQKPLWQVTTNNLIQNHIARLSGLTITYQGQPVEQLSISKVMFWNEGTKRIEANDIPQAVPLQIVGVDGVEILGAELLASNEKANQFSYEWKKGDPSILLKFDYLSHREGAVFQVVHTGTSSEDIKVEGKLKDVQICYKKKRSTDDFYPPIKLLLSFLLVWGSYIGAVFVIANSVKSIIQIPFLVLIGAVGMLIGVLLWQLGRLMFRSRPKHLRWWAEWVLGDELPPKGLEVFDNKWPEDQSQIEGTLTPSEVNR